MKLLSIIFKISLFFSLSCGDDNNNQEARSEENLFSNPLILGASISSGFETNDGGLSEVIAREINSDAQIINEAESGATSVESTQNLDLNTYDPSVVMALDLFFWDAVRNRCDEEFETNTRKIFQTFQDRGIPLIVGKVPINVVFPSGIASAGITPCSSRINELIEGLCTEDNECLIYDPKDCFDAMGLPISPEGMPYFSNSFHTTEAGNSFCTEQFVEAGEYRRL